MFYVVALDPIFMVKPLSKELQIYRFEPLRQACYRDTA